jgi:hypothetical protein
MNLGTYLVTHAPWLAFDEWFLLVSFLYLLRRTSVHRLYQAGSVCDCLSPWTVIRQKGTPNYVNFFLFCFGLFCHSATFVELVEAAPLFLNLLFSLYLVFLFVSISLYFNIYMI